MGDGSPDYPDVSQEEKDLNKKQTELLQLQTEILQKSYSEQQVLAPVLLKEAGLVPSTDAEGNVTGYTIDPEVQAFNKKRLAIESLGLDRQKQALEGNIPLPEGLQRQFSEDERVLREDLLKSLGKDYATSSPGIEALGRLREQRNVVTDAFRRGEIGLNDALTQSTQQQYLRGLAGLSQAGLNPFNAANQFSNATTNQLSGYADLASRLAGYRNARYQGDLASYQGQQQLYMGLGSSAAQIGSMAFLFAGGK